MGKFFGGFLVASGLAVATYFSGLLGPDVDTCGGFCGEGSGCSEGQCVAVASASTEDDDTDEAEPSKNKRRKRRSERGSGGEHGGEAGAEDGLAPFVPINDSGVPRFNRKSAKTIDLDAGSERLSDRVVNQELAKLDSRFQRCVATAAIYSDDALRGSLNYELGIAGSGKVTGVNVKAPGSLKVFGIVPCVRKAIHGHRFPSFDGPTMGVEGSFRVD